MRGKSLARLSLCQRGRRVGGSQSSFVSAFAGKRSHYGAKARVSSLETIFRTAMHVRERYFALSARAQPDDSAKLETLKHVASGKEHPAVVAFRNERCVCSLYCVHDCPMASPACLLREFDRTTVSCAACS